MTIEGSTVEADRPWHSRPAAEVVEALSTSERGLGSEEATRRLKETGPNRLPEAPRQHPLIRFFAQFRNVLIGVLLAAAVLAVTISHYVDAVVILAVVLANAVIGFVQEGRAEQAIAAIRSMIDPTASVLRNGRRVTVPAEEVVPGDLVLLEAGDRIPADTRLLHASSMRVDEAALTGESVPVEKDVAPVSPDAPLGDRQSMVYSGTFVTAGQGNGVVVATGANSELGRISTLIVGVEQLATPLTQRMDRFSRGITLVVLVVSAAVFAFAVLVRNYAWDEAVMVVVGLAVGAIPEGLPAVMTVTLAVGVRRMARRNAIIRRLPAVETLGSVSVICSDKTGTLTMNEMTVRTILAASGEVAVESAADGQESVFRRNDVIDDPSGDPEIASVAEAGLLCNDAEATRSDGRWVVAGDPMEGALVSLALNAGLDADALRSARPRLAEVPFDSRNRYMATLHEGPDGTPVLYVKGAPEQVFALCDKIAGHRGEELFEPQTWAAAVEALASDGQRVLALARRDLDPGTRSIGSEDLACLTLLGCVGLVDPPRPEARPAVLECRNAGITVKMITGDHGATARSIAAELGLDDDPTVVTGRELDDLDAEQFRRVARETTVFARTSPEHKLRLVEALQADGAVVAMTGDGVNDAPALKRADIGVAMGGKGTEAAKEASRMVLTDDNFASIVAAVREGRTVFDNLKKVISWTLPTNGGEATIIILAVAFGLILPVTPLQILWINTVTAAALGLPLAFEPTEPGVMRRPVRPAGAGVLDRRLVWRIVLVSLLMAMAVFIVFLVAGRMGHSVATARTMVVNSVVAMEVAYLFSVRYSYTPSLTWRGIAGTPAVWTGIAVVTLAQAVFTYLPAMNRVFDTRPLGLTEIGIVLLTGVVLFAIVEAEKLAGGRPPASG